MDKDNIIEFENYTHKLNKKVIKLDPLNEDKRDSQLPVIRVERDKLNWRVRRYSKIRIQEYKSMTRDIPSL
jgi:hypothetical protein